MIARLLLVAMPLLLLGCGQDDFSDLHQFMAEAGKNSTAKVEPLPAVKPQDPITYHAEELPDPFSMGPLRPGQEDTAKPRGPLEEYPLELLRVAGILQKGGVYHALIATPENRLYQVRKGDRIGQNGGIVTRVHGKGIEIRERVRNSLGNWTEVKTSLVKQEDADNTAPQPAK